MKKKLLCTCRSLIICACLSTACGRYGPPLYPEQLSPRAVKELTVIADLQGVKFSWVAPSEDRRGKELKSMDGYRLYRRVFIDASDVTDERADYELIGEVEDTHLIELEALRKQAREAGKVSRKVKIDQDKLKFQLVDSKVEPGVSYLYKVIPVNQDGVEGAVQQFVKVNYHGELSTINFVDYTGSEDPIS